MADQSSHLAQVHGTWKRLQHRKKTGYFQLDGLSLDVADVIAIAYHGCKAQLSQNPKIEEALQSSIDVLFDHLARGWYVYGVNTGFGGSADSRTDQVVALQASLMQHTQSGILSSADDGMKPGHSMPAPWVRAAMVVRCNSTMRGHSAVSLPVIRALADLLAHDLTPVVPLRGSVSASGDLMPLAYVAGSLEGNPDILLEKDGRVLSAPQALENAGLKPVLLGPKEGLGLINGTSSSAGLGALVVAAAHDLAFLTQVLSAAAVEALCGSAESFHPFIAQTRPHAGQVECARNIKFLLEGSHLSRDVLKPKDRRREDLVQDRYSLRSAPQWIGPQLEDLLLAHRQITTELNSSCDNPLVDSREHDIYYGCNFQAAVVTSAVEKVRLSLQMFGRLLFAQTTEMIDPHLSGGLPANLAADDPSLSFTMKGVDVNMAAYMAELSYLANPMSSHVQSAEMHNQSVNSMAMASARMTADAVDILTQMTACHTFVACQALDLRALHMKFITRATDTFMTTTENSFSASLTAEQLAALQAALKAHIRPSWASSSKLDLSVRCEALVSSAIPIVVAHIPPKCTMAQIHEWRDEATNAILGVWNETFRKFVADPHTVELLGKGSRVLYQFVRQQLGVPFHQGFVEHPTIHNDQHDGRRKKTIGGWISIIHHAVKSGALCNALITTAAEGLLGISHGVNGQ
ncbi:Phenylalanine ammonia-lyase [Cytospora mali]|uniref:Phenylalanine ammonia-lyase n=1 Tax=Cytospora mali TaxID=578113 RepID=A0A194W1G9_CYTMA|nr:Phenylalanine ammonia-lyase [Valsa mali]